MKIKNSKMYRACGQHVSASDDKCTDLKRHPYMMETEPQHTPTPEDLMIPWVQGDNTPEDEHGNNACCIYDEDSAGNKIADCINPETAAFIVRAVNAHEELLNALQIAQATIERLDSDHSSTQGTHDVINEAIAKAEEK